MKLIKISGFYKDVGKIEFENLKIIEWQDITEENPPVLPIGSRLELSVSLDQDDFLSGKNGNVWATYNLRQAEIIQSALFAQHINSEVKKISIGDNELFFIKITFETDIRDAIDFIWGSNTGLRLKPDWSYPQGEKNKSFEQWLSDH